MTLFTTAISAAALLFGSILHAQTSDRITVRFATPVLVGETQIPAGQCDIQVMRSNADSILLVVRPESGAAVSVLANHYDNSSAKVKGDANVILDKKGDNLHLSQILFPDNTGYQVTE